MGFVRVWWPPVVVGLVVAVLGIGAVEVAVMPAGGVPMVSAPVQPQSRPARVAPAAIERADDVAQPEPRLRPTTTPRPTRTAPPSPAAARRAVPTVDVTPEPEPTAMRSATPVPKPKPKPKPNPKPVRTPSPSPTPSPTAPPTAPPMRRVVPIVSTPPPPVRPAQILDLRRWKLTLPTGREGHPTEVRQPALGSLVSGAFARLRPDRGVAFRAPVGGVTTENSSYPRSELREMSADGRREAAWSSASGRHLMTITQAITATPRAKPHVVAGQVHDGDDDVIMIRLEGGRLFVESDGDDVGLLDARYRLGTRFTVAIAATRAGIRITYDPLPHRSGIAVGGPPTSRVVHVPEVGHGWYFKAGCYVQSNPNRGDRPSAYGEVVIYALTVSHT